MSTIRTEAGMYRPLVNHFRERGMVVLREVTTHEGRVDVVAAHIDWEAASRRLELGFTAGLTTIPLLRAWECLAAASTPIDSSSWAAAMSLQPASLAALARELVRRGFATRHGRGYAKTTTCPSVLGELVCCEAKLVDWRRGLGQAYGHRFYADRIYLALADRTPRGLDRCTLQERAVGLLTVRDDTVEVEVEAPKRVPGGSRVRALLAERIWVQQVVPTLRAQRRAPTRLHAATG